GSGDDTNPCSRPLPCRNFTAAIAQTDDDGEVVVLDSGGYGTFTIDRPLSVIAPAGVHAGIAAFTFDGILVNVNNDAHVVLKNLVINDQGAINAGISVGSVAA